MPHVIVKLWPGPSEQAKQRLAERIVQTLVETIGTQETSVSVAIEEVLTKEWMARV